VDAGTIGQVVNIQYLEPVGYWHQAHSYVRGNSRNEAQSSFMLLAKSCHDLDWILHIMGGHCQKVSSFGSLVHFRRENQPAGAADRCLDCGVEPTCPYSAIKIYHGFLDQGHTNWPVDVLTSDVTPEGLRKALREGPYGRCVYACDNDVVDHQVVNMQFADGRTASFTMTAFAETTPRRTRAFGTRGMLEGDGKLIRHFDFLRDTWQTIDTDASWDGSILNGHGGGDIVMIRRFIDAVASNDPSLILSGPDQTLESHLMVFAAERARHNGTVEDVKL
jgi:predicted dehydrogenase